VLVKVFDQSMVLEYTVRGPPTVLLQPIPDGRVRTVQYCIFARPFRFSLTRHILTPRTFLGVVTLLISNQMVSWNIYCLPLTEIHSTPGNPATAPSSAGSTRQVLERLCYILVWFVW